MLKVDKINIFYHDIHVLKEVSLKVESGEFVPIFGPNGHGKSTLLKTICGLVRPVSGRIEYDGERIDGLPPDKIVELGLTYIAEVRHLFPQMTVMENLKLGAYNKKAWPRRNERLDYVFQLFPRLKLFKDRLAFTLSGGERRMLAIGRGLMSCAKFLAIDEPSVGLAPNLRTEVFKKIEEIHKSGITVLLVEQNIVQVLKFTSADRAYLIEDGKIVFEGNIEEAVSNGHVKKVFLGI